MLPPGQGEDNDPADWGEVFTIFLKHTSISYEGILERTIPQIEAVMGHLHKHIGLTVGVPVRDEPKMPGEEHTVEDAMAFMAAFNGT